MKATHLIARLAGLSLGLAPAFLLAQDATAIVERVGHDIEFLASDEMEGRGPGTAGLQKAAEYIRGEFHRLGLTSGVPDGSYLQPFQIDLSVKVVADKTRVRLTAADGETIELKLGKDYQALAVGGSGRAAAEIVFVGYGISAEKPDYDEYKNLDVTGKVVLMLRREPQQNDPDSAFDGKKTTLHSTIQNKLKLAKDKGAAGILFVNEPAATAGGKQDTLTGVTGFGAGGSQLPFAHLTQATVNRLLATKPLKTSAGESLTTLADVEQYIDQNLQPVSAPLDGWMAEMELTFETVKADVANVIGVIEGAGPDASEAILLGAHYDHIGFGEFGSRYRGDRKVHNGADDNASGTAAILELARRYAGRTNPPARRMIFIGFSAEERGLIGSDYYIKQPVYPVAETVAMFNFDMVGQLRNNELTVFGSRSSKQFPTLIEQANRNGELKLKLPPNIIRSGDHYGFYHAGVPAFHFFSGFTKQYHTPDDDYETLSIDGVVTTIDYAERLLDAVLEMDDRPEYVKVEPVAGPPQSVAYLGVTPDYAAGSDGVPISGVMDNSPASQGGLKAGDVIVKLADIQVADFAALKTGLQKHKPGETVKIVVKRGDEEIACEVKLGSVPGQ